jgi:hypothetical protein
MLDRIPPASSGDIATYGAARQVRETERVASGFRLASLHGLPTTPPAEVLRALDGAARVDVELRSRGLSVSFDVQPEGSVRVRVVDGGGSTVRELGPSEALDALGDEHAFDALGV